MNILSTHIPLVPCQLAIPFLRYSIFKVWSWKSKVKVIAQGHKVGITPYQLISLPFHVNRPKCCLIWQVFGPWASPYGANGQITMTLHNYRSRQVHDTLNGVNPSSRFRDLRSAKSGPNLCQILQVFGPWASPYGANGQITMTLHNYRSRQVHDTLNGVNPSSRFRDLRSAKSGPNLCQILQVFGPWASPYGGKWANDHDSAQLQV